MLVHAFLVLRLCDYREFSAFSGTSTKLSNICNVKKNAKKAGVRRYSTSLRVLGDVLLQLQQPHFSLLDVLEVALASVAL